MVVRGSRLMRSVWDGRRTYKTPEAMVLQRNAALARAMVTP